MRTDNFFKLIQIDEYSATPKYLQLCDSIVEAIENGKLKKGDVLPSINELSYALDISRDTAEKGYKHLKKQNILVSVPGKGYYIGQTDFKKKIRVFLLFNKLSAHKKIIYDAFVAALGEEASIDFYIYNNDYTIFKKLIQSKRSDYSHYVIIPHFVEGGDDAYQIINTIPAEKLILLDKKLEGIVGNYSAVYENFRQDIYQSLHQAKKELSKYHTLKLIFPDKSYYPTEIIDGFKLFCQQYAFNHQIIHNIESEPIAKGEVYINLMEHDLVTLIEKILSLNFELGKEVGIISYNETPLKKLLLNGITTISTDFKLMGTIAAEMIKNQISAHREIPFALTLRASL
ncbi:GntR family transcriptional regulator [Pedobacter glucosidilyticus]|uniref:GntR family transcriptional regulator n=1 Tax=Pedobacter glucosidilyticus TaxID=1122941 RepID=UPI0026F127AD|nr:GntR family transcriptional regulator [Pedobacter glucosidilyticus]